MLTIVAMEASFVDDKPLGVDTITNKDTNQAIRELLREQGSFTSGELSERVGKSRQALHRNLSSRVKSGLLVREGQGRATRYRAAGGAIFERQYDLAGLQEDKVWDELRAWIDGSGSEPTQAAQATLGYAVTELVNNAIDHSGAASVTVRAALEDEFIRVTITDEGIGAFENLRSRLGLDDHLHALQELSKGKVTTAPNEHTGEGIFFTSKMVERFELAASRFAWVLDNRLGDQAVREVEQRVGTEVFVELSLQSRTRPEEVFARYTHDFEFDTTRCVIRLFEHGLSFVSRSEAKRLVAGLERFREVILDFRGVDGVGQGFVDEVFRVWARAHSDVKLTPRDMNAAVEFMVRRGLGGGPSAAPTKPGDSR